MSTTPQSSVSLEALKSLAHKLKPDQITTSLADRNTYGRDWTKFFTIDALAVVFPESTADVVAIVNWAKTQGVSLVPSGGRTGLSGGAVAANKEVVVSFERMNKIIEFNAFDRLVRVEAGVITQQLQEFAREQNLFFPIDFAAKGSSQIGGNIATNAGGVKVVRYGLTRDWVAALKVVTGNGNVLEFNQGLIKNATGYDFRHLFIGSEGTLGFVTEATLRLATPPPALSVLVLGLQDLKNVMEVFKVFRQNLTLTAYEMFSNLALEKVVAHHALSRPFATNTPFYVLVEIENDNELQTDKILSLFEQCIESGWVIDGIVSQSEQQSRDLWSLRELISESLSSYTPYKNDISVKISQIQTFVAQMETQIAENYPDFEVVWFGHIGDGNLHINILKPENMNEKDFFARAQLVDKILFRHIKEFGGAISAEHGIGLVKKSHLSFSRSPEEIELMRSIKKLFDPASILNPGKIFNL